MDLLGHHDDPGAAQRPRDPPETAGKGGPPTDVPTPHRRRHHPLQIHPRQLLQEDGGNIEYVQPYLSEQTEINARRPLTPQQKTQFDIAEAGIIILEIHLDRTATGKTAPEKIRRKAQHLEAFSRLLESSNKLHSNRDQIKQLVSIREKICRGEALEQELVRGLTDLGTRIFEPGSPERQPKSAGREE